MTVIFVFTCFEAMKIAVPVAVSKFWVITQSSVLADILFNDVLSDFDFRLSGVILEACWCFVN